MNAIDCLVHPQIGTEALGLVICEAHACGKPVIASALDGIPEAFRAGNYGRLVPPEDIAALADADGGAGEPAGAWPRRSRGPARKSRAGVFPGAVRAKEVLRSMPAFDSLETM